MEYSSERECAKAFMQVLVLNETMEQFSMANSVCWYCYVLRREGGHALRRALDFKVDGQIIRKGSLKWM